MRDVLYDSSSDNSDNIVSQALTPAEKAENLAWETARVICNGNPLDVLRLVNSDRGHLLFTLAKKSLQEGDLNGNAVQVLTEKYQNAIAQNQIPSWLKGETL